MSMLETEGGVKLKAAGKSTSVKCCGNCAHYRAMFQQCRRHAPVVMLIGVHQNGVPQTYTTWPTVPADDPGCGDFDRDVMIRPEPAAEAAADPRN